MRSPEHSSEPSATPETGSKDAAVMEVVDLLSDTEELAEHSTDERRAVITITDV